MKNSSKRGNPDWVSSSFYMPKKLKYRFDRAMLALQERGESLDRSDVIVSALTQFCAQIESSSTFNASSDH